MDNKPSFTKKVSQWRGLPLVLIALAFGSSFIVSLSFDRGVPFAVIYALVAVALTVVTIVAPLQYKAKADLELVRLYGGTAEERRLAAHKRLGELRENLSWKNVHKTAWEYWSKALIVGGYLAVYAWVMYTFYGVLPENAFAIPLWALAVIWLVLLLFLGRVMAVVLLLALTGIMAIVSVMGPTILLQFLPYFFTMPLLMVMNFAIMFGPLTITNLMQIKVILPLEGEDKVMLEDIRGLGDLVKQIVRTLNVFQSGDKNALYREKGIMMFGPPGTGKTMTARAIATRLEYPMIDTTGSAFTATFIGIPIIIMLYLFWLAENLAAYYGGCLIYIDEIDQLARARQGVETGKSGSGWDGNFFSLLPHDRFGALGDLRYDCPESLAIAEMHRTPPASPIVDGMFLGGMGMGMSNMALPIYLSKLDGVPTAPLFERFWRSKLNQILDICYVPPVIHIGKRKKNLRVPRAKPVEPNILHMGSTNIPDQLDGALMRPGRFGLQLKYGLPNSPEARLDIANLYFDKVEIVGLLHPELLKPERRMEFAHITSGLSPAEIMQVITQAPTVQAAFVARLRDIANMINAGEKPDESDARFWKSHGHEYGQPDWDKPRATWSSLVESFRIVQFGLAQPLNTSTKMREVVAVHETEGHLLPLAGFSGASIKAEAISILPRDKFLGIVSHRPIEQQDPQQQWVWEARLRTTLGSIAAEKLRFGDHRPGVSSDLQNATRVAAGMAGHLNFTPRACNEADRQRYLEYGRGLFVPAPAMPGVADPVAGVLGNREKLEDVCVTLGMAYVDSWRLIRKNQGLAQPIIDKLLDQDEIIGDELDVIWQELQKNIKQLTPADQDVWPPLATPNPFYTTEEVAQ